MGVETTAAAHDKYGERTAIPGFCQAPAGEWNEVVLRRAFNDREPSHWCAWTREHEAGSVS